LELLNAQRALSAVRCQQFIQTLRQSCEHATNSPPPSTDISAFRLNAATAEKRCSVERPVPRANPFNASSGAPARLATESNSESTSLSSDESDFDDEFEHANRRALASLSSSRSPHSGATSSSSVATPGRHHSSVRFALTKPLCESLDYRRGDSGHRMATPSARSRSARWMESSATLSENRPNGDFGFEAASPSAAVGRCQSARWAEDLRFYDDPVPRRRWTSPAASPCDSFRTHRALRPCNTSPSPQLEKFNAPRPRNTSKRRTSLDYPHESTNIFS
ncbi:hypothetical protein CLOP_g8484, partial [Closterium sp. NIES-67]